MEKPGEAGLNDGTAFPFVMLVVNLREVTRHGCEPLALVNNWCVAVI